MVSKTTGFILSHKVSPVVVSFIPARATMSPAKASSISSLLFECIIIILPTRSFFPFVEFNKESPFLIDPEYILKKVNDPTKGSFIILKARPEKGSLSSAVLSIFLVSVVSPGRKPVYAGTSRGSGR